MGAMVVDTNVVFIAEGLHEAVSPDCEEACILRLQSIMSRDRVVLDEGFQILGEYGHKIDLKRHKGPGRVFLKWLLQNRAGQILVGLVENLQRGFESFPDDEALNNFDPPDRKFVAVAALSPEPAPILQAADSKWVDWAVPLARHGVEVLFVCENDIQRFRKNKGLP